MKKPGRRPRYRCACGRKCRDHACSRCLELEAHEKPKPRRRVCLAAGPGCHGPMHLSGYCERHHNRVQRDGTTDGQEDYPRQREISRVRVLIPSLFPGQRFGPMTGGRMLAKR